ncbi:MAG: serine hydroxymethyltransferase [Vicinamibacterales bacterium]
MDSTISDRPARETTQWPWTGRPPRVGGVDDELERLREDDPQLARALDEEERRQELTLSLVASSSVMDPSVRACLASPIGNLTAEGYPGSRFHAGCVNADAIENLAIERANDLFGARYANVQPHSASSANELLLFRLMNPGDCLMGMSMHAGGHLSHGSRVSVSGKYFNVVSYGLDARERLDYEEIEALTRRYRPKVIICGATAYSRPIDFARFRQIADTEHAYLLADITHIAGLVAGGQHQNPVDHAHFTVTCTHKQLYGPRGGLILCGRDFDQAAPDRGGTIADVVQKSVFPYFQGAPFVHVIAAKATAFRLAATPAFRALAARIVSNARALARAFRARGYDLVSGGTDNHIVLVDVFQRRAISGHVAERALEACGIVVNRNQLFRDEGSKRVSGIRIGTNTVARRGMSEPEMEQCADLIDRVLSATTPEAPHVTPRVSEEVAASVSALCARFPIAASPRPVGKGPRRRGHPWRDDR